MNHLFRSLAPVSDTAWGEINDEAVRSLTHFLAARKLVDVEGPLGYDVSSVSLGRRDPLTDQPGAGVTGALRRVQPLVEFHRHFELARSELDALDAGAADADLDAVLDACRSLASAEDHAVFNGLSSAGIAGMSDGSPHDPIELSNDFERYPNLVAKAVAVLKDAGVAGPYALALGPKCYAGVIETTQKGGYPVMNHLTMILGGPVVWAPVVDGAIVLSERGGDFRLTLGEDTSIAYVAHDAESVTLELQETMTFQSLSPEAAVVLRYP